MRDVDVAAPVQLLVPHSTRLPLDDIPTANDLDGLQEVKWELSTSWLWNTHYQMKRMGVETVMVDRLPESGIVLASAHAVPIDYRPNSSQYFVSIAADSPPRLFADAHIVQNVVQVDILRTTFRDPLVVHIPHWPQPGLRGRSMERGDRFERVGFYGAINQLDDSFKGPAWEEIINELGLEMVYRFRHGEMHDFSDVDAIISVRTLDGNLHHHKPASKLVNAWHARVPAILGPESAFKNTGTHGKDYVEVDSVEATVQALRRLKHDIKYRRQLVEHGARRADDFTEHAIAQQWKEFIVELLPQATGRIASRRAFYRTAYRFDQFTRRAMRSIRNRIKL